MSPGRVEGYLAHKNPPPYDPAVALCLGTYGDPRGVDVSYVRLTPVWRLIWSSRVLPPYLAHDKVPPLGPYRRLMPRALLWS